MLRKSLPILAAACCGVALFGCGESPTPSPTPVPSPIQAAWNNHLGGFGAGVLAADAAEEAPKTAALAQIMNDYDESSVVRMWVDGVTPVPGDATCSDDDAAVACKTYTGITAIENFFKTLFPQMAGCTGDGADQLQFSVDVDEVAEQVFLVWKCTKMSIYRATDSFIFDGKIIRNQNIVFSKLSEPSESTTKSQNRRLQTDYNPANVSEAWTNHLAAFGAGAAATDDVNKSAAVDKILLDYTDQSEIRVWDFASTMGADGDAFEKYKGLVQIRTLFTILFTLLTDSGDLSTPLQFVQESAPKQVFLVWTNPGSSFHLATDTFLFDDAFKITAQNIALHADCELCHPPSQNTAQNHIAQNVV